MTKSILNKTVTSTAIATAAIASAPVNAAIVHVDNAPMTYSIAQPGNWDVDGVGNAEFEFRHDHFVDYYSSRFTSDVLAMASGGTLNGRGIIRYASATVIAAALSRSEYAGASLPASLMLVEAGQSGLAVLRNFRGYPPSVPASNFAAFGDLSGFLGFAFDPGDGVHYGWARLTFVDSGPDSTVTIEEWAYEDKAGKAIHVGSIPAPPAAVPALTLLGLGAAGVRAWRKRCGEKDEPNTPA